MRTSRLLAAAAVALASAGCADRSPTLSAPDAPSRYHVTSLNVYCPSSLRVGYSSSCSAYGWDIYGHYHDYTYSASWGSTSYGVLNVGFYGGIYGVAAGNASVYAIVDGTWGWSGNVSVYNPPPPSYPASVTVSPGSATVFVGQSAGFTARVYDQYGNQMSGQTVTWSSSNTSVATVGSSGYAQGVSLGSATITATAGGVSGTAGVSVVSGFFVGISGPDVVDANQSCTWYADVSGGAGPYSYSWYAWPADGSSLYEPSSWTGSSSASSFTIDLTVTDANGVSVSASKQVSTNSTSGPIA